MKITQLQKIAFIFISFFFTFNLVHAEEKILEMPKSADHLAGLDLSAMSYTNTIGFDGLNEANLKSEKLIKIFKEQAKSKGITLTDENTNEPMLTLVVHTVGNAQQGYAFVVRIELIEPIIMKRKGKKYSSFSRTWRAKILGHLPVSNLSEDTFTPGISNLLDHFVKTCKLAKLPEPK